MEIIKLIPINMEGTMRFFDGSEKLLEKIPQNSDIYYKLVSIKSGRESFPTEPVFVSTKSDKRNLPQSPSNILLNTMVKIQ